MISNSTVQESKKTLHALIVSRNKPYSISLKKVLEGQGFSADVCLAVNEVTNQVTTFNSQIVFIEENLWEASGIDLIGKLKTFDPNLKTVLIADVPNIQSSVEAFR